MIINIDIDKNKNCFFLSGDTKRLLDNRRAKIYLKDFLNANITSNAIEIPYITEDLELILKKVKIFLEKFEVYQQYSDTVTGILHDFFQEEENFSVFSKQAYNIRNNLLNEKESVDFSNFTKILLNQLPSRRLYPLQLLSAYHLAFSQNACNFSVPGSGKTSIVYAAYSYLSAQEKNNPKYIDKLFIIGPLSSFGPWENEYIECFGKKPNIKRISGNVSRKDRVSCFYSDDPPEIILISYNSVINLETDIISFLKKHHVMVVLDEAHRIKNTMGGITAESVLRLAKYCDSRVILTGTPAPNGYEDIFNLFKFIWPTKNIIPFHLFQLKEMSETIQDSRIPTLIDSVSPYFIRIRKSDLHLPEPINHEPYYVQMGKVQREIYEYIEKNYLSYFESENKSDGLKGKLAQARLIRLMQVSTNPALLKKPITEFFDGESFTDTFIDDSSIINKIQNYDSLEIPPKFIYTKELIEKILSKGEKVIVWATFVQNIDDFRTYLETSGINCEVLYGQTPIEKEELDPIIKTREKIIHNFHNTNCPYKVIIANPFAVSESISLHKVCHNAIYLERTFNATHYIQSKDRIHRYGLKSTDITNYYYVLSDNNTDFTINQRLLEKEQRMLEIIESQEIPLFSRIDSDEEDDIKALINNYVNRPSEK